MNASVGLSSLLKKQLFYTILSVLSFLRGKFGTVNKCIAKESKKTWAAKFIKAEKPEDKKEVRES